MEYFPTLYTDRLILRKMTVDDIPSLLKHVNNRVITDEILNFPYPYQEPQAVFRISYVHQGFKKKERFVFAITTKEQKELIGEISLHLNQVHNQSEVGYWVGESFWKQGIATEAVGRILQFGFAELGVTQIFATHRNQNIASAKVLLKNGMRKGSTPPNTVSRYELTREEYLRIS
ncbi:MAG: GNAT family N-acetyltransferase [Bacteroidota bacterium]